jgi:hypothetical protein
MRVVTKSPIGSAAGKALADAQVAVESVAAGALRERARTPLWHRHGIRETASLVGRRACTK